MVYLLASEEALDTGEESGWLITWAPLFFEIIASQQVALRPVSPEEVMAAEEANSALSLKTLRRVQNGIHRRSSRGPARHLQPDAAVRRVARRPS